MTTMYFNHQINTWMTTMASTYKDMVTMFEVGKTFEGKSINMLKVCMNYRYII